MAAAAVERVRWPRRFRGWRGLSKPQRDVAWIVPWTVTLLHATLAGVSERCPKPSRSVLAATISFARTRVSGVAVEPDAEKTLAEEETADPATAG